MKRLLPSMALLLIVGCLERTETIVIQEDGGARLATIVRGDPGDVSGGEALPSQETGWQVEERTETDSEGKQTLTRTASKVVAVGQPLPATYAAAGSRAEQLGLAFPTTLNTEVTDEGTYYHFRREYRRRAWWTVEYLRQRSLETDEVKRLFALDPKTLTEAERATLVDALAGFGAEAMGAFLDLAVAELSPPLDQRPYLDARRSGTAVYRDRQLAAQVVALLTEDASIKLEPLEQEVRARAKDALSVSLRDAGLAADRIDALLEAYERVRETYELTKDLSDESWKVRLTLPGTIVAHNGAEAEGGAVEWRFDGKAFFDRDLVLMATSFLPKEGK